MSVLPFRAVFHQISFAEAIEIGLREIERCGLANHRIAAIYGAGELRAGEAAFAMVIRQSTASRKSDAPTWKLLIRNDGGTSLHLLKKYQRKERMKST